MHDWAVEGARHRNRDLGEVAAELGIEDVLEPKEPLPLGPSEAGGYVEDVDAQTLAAAFEHYDRKAAERHEEAMAAYLAACGSHEWGDRILAEEEELL